MSDRYKSPTVSAGADASGVGHKKTYHCGTLTYTKVGLFMLFAFLLWGDFAITLMDTVVPSILPLKLKNLGSSNIIIGLFLSSIPSFMAVCMNPYISFKSDRFRSKWGRRIPFILFTLPFLCLSMLLLAFSEDISGWLHAYTQLSEIAPATMTIITIGIFFVAYNFFHMFVGSVFWYIFNDVVPVVFLGRFMGLMRIASGIASFFYSYFIFKYAESHMREIFIGTAVLYFIGVGMMCFFVKEGEYPPISASDGKLARGWEGFKTFFRESFCHKIYWAKCIFRGVGFVGVAAGAFSIFFLKDMGLSLDDVGKAGAIVSVAGIALAYFASVFIDRWHPLRIITYSSVFAVVFAASSWVWLFVTLSPKAFFWLYMLGTGLIGTLHSLLAGLSSLPMDMRLCPKSRFGQFCAAQSIIFHIGTILGGIGVGIFFDSLKKLFHGSDYIYRFSFVWNLFWLLIAAIAVCSVYRQWQALGGDKHYHPPAPWSKTGFEEEEQTPFVGCQTRWLKYTLGAIHLLMLLSIVYLIPLAYWLWRINWSFDFKWHMLAIIPIAVALYAAWIFVERAIKADVALYIAAKPTRDGIPHHGVFFVKACALLLILTVWIGMTITAIHDGLQGGVMVFGIGNLITNALVIGAVLVLRRLERGYDPMLDYDGHKEKCLQAAAASQK